MIGIFSFLSALRGRATDSFSSITLVARSHGHGPCANDLFKGFRSSGFSLIEIVISLGIVGFSFMAILGVLPVGLENFRHANNMAITTQISQRVINELQQTDFDLLLKDSTGTANETYCYVWTLSGNAAQSSVRYFDDQGDEVFNAAQAVFRVNTRITPATTLPKTGTGVVDNANLATVAIQIANNPGGIPLAMGSSAPFQNLWTNTVIPISTFFTVVARNK